MRNVQTSVSQTYHRRGSKEAMGGLGAKHPATGRFFVIFWEKLASNFLGKTSYFNVIGSQFARVYNHFKKLDF